MRKLKLLHLNAGTNLGGTETMILRFLDNVDKTRFQISIGAFFNNGPLLSEVEKRNFESRLFKIKHQWNLFEVLFALLKLYHFLKSKKIDIIHMYGFYTNILGRIAARMAKTTIVITGLRMEKFGRNGFHSFLERMTSHWTDRYISISERGQELMLQKQWIEKEKVIVIHSGIDNNWAIGRTLENQNHRVGMIAAFSRFKAHEQIVLAAPSILRTFPDTKFFLAGEGKTKQRIIKLITSLGINANFDFLGDVQDVRQILSKLSVFVLASHTEGLPVSILEAMALGLPVVASKVGGIPELVEDGFTGILVELNHPEEFASAIIQLLSNPEKARRMGEQGKLRIQKEYTLEQMTKKLEDCYYDLAMKKGLW
ncbi:MAG: glycosyltransferase [Candidatus Bathyarchaeota archaeon]|nr:glycosyltransferase [Candidatus Bathyarchaeota archaeon]